MIRKKALRETVAYWTANAEEGFSAANAENALRKELRMSGKPVPKTPLMKLRRIVIVTAIVFVLAGLVPPWVQTYDRGDAGYAFILTPPKNVRVRLDTSRLMVEWACILAVAGVVWFLSITKEAKNDTKF